MINLSFFLEKTFWILFFQGYFLFSWREEGEKVPCYDVFIFFSKTILCLPIRNRA